VLCYFETAAGRLPELVRAIDDAGLGLEGLTVSEPTLDDVFLEATGHRMGPKGGEGAGAGGRHGTGAAAASGGEPGSGGAGEAAPPGKEGGQ